MSETSVARDILSRRPNGWRLAVPSLLYGGLLLLIITLNVISRPFVSVFGVSLSYYVIVLLVVGVAIRLVVDTDRRSRARSLAKGDFVVTFRRDGRFRRAIARLVERDLALADAWSTAVSADSDGLIIWETWTRKQVIAIPWSIVDGVRSRSQGLFDDTVTITIDLGDELVELPLRSPTTGLLEFQSSLETRWIASEMARLRADH